MPSRVRAKDDADRDDDEELFALYKLCQAPSASLPPTPKLCRLPSVLSRSASRCTSTPLTAFAPTPPPLLPRAPQFRDARARPSSSCSAPKPRSPQKPPPPTPPPLTLPPPLLLPPTPPPTPTPSPTLPPTPPNADNAVALEAHPAVCADETVTVGDLFGEDEQEWNSEDERDMIYPPIQNECWDGSYEPVRAPVPADGRVAGAEVERVFVQETEDLPCWRLAVERDLAYATQQGAGSHLKVLSAEYQVLESKEKLKVYELGWYRFEYRRVVESVVTDEHVQRARQALSRARRRMKKKLAEYVEQKARATRLKAAYDAAVSRLESRVRELHESGAFTAIECRALHADGREHWDEPPLSSSDSDGSHGYSEVDSDDSIQDDLRRATRARKREQASGASTRARRKQPTRAPPAKRHSPAPPASPATHESSSGSESSVSISDSASDEDEPAPKVAPEVPPEVAPEVAPPLERSRATASELREQRRLARAARASE